MPGPARKRQKTVHKVAELEKKINALTDALLAKNAANPTPPSDSPASYRMDAQSDITRTSTTTAQSEGQNAVEMLKNREPAFSGGVATKNLAGQLDMKFCPTGPSQSVEPYVDIIERGILDMDTAATMFNHFVANMSPHFPIVSFPLYVKASDVRTARPMVFLAILSAASAAFRPDLQQDLVAELSRQLSERVMFMGEKSLELVQAMLLYTAYYVRSRFAKDLAFNQYIHSAVVMCLDLGMGKRYPHKIDRNEVEEAEDPSNLAGLLLLCLKVSILRTCTVLLLISSVFHFFYDIHRLVRWSSYLEDSVELFSRPDAQLGDRWLACLCSLARITEEVSIVFSLDDGTSTISFSEMKTQYHLKAFERQLDHWRASVPEAVDKRIVDHHYHSANLYIHEIAIHSDHDVDDFRPEPPSRTKPPTGSFVTTAHIDALTACLDSSQRVLNSYLKLDLETCRSTPNLLIVWNTYSIVALIKLHGVLHAPDSMFGSIFTPDLRVDYYLDAITTKLQEVSANQRWPPAEAFIFVTKKLQSWHTHKRAPYLVDVNNISQIELMNENSSEAEKNENTADNLIRRIPNAQGLPENWGGAKASPTTTTAASYNNLVPPTTTTAGGDSQQMFWASQGGITSDLNAAYNAANYNIDWNDLNFSQDEMNVFDSYMNDSGWMSYLI